MSVKIYGMICGNLTLPRYGLLGGEDTETRIKIPIPSFLIEHPKGSVVFDTGLETQLHDEDCDYAEALGPLLPVATVDYKPGEDVAARLEAAGRDPGKIDYLVNSHLHLDHAGGNVLIPNAQWIIQRREHEAAHGPEDHNFYRPRLFDHGHDVVKADGEHDIFGDGSVVCVPTYGHTRGHQSLRIRNDDGEVMLTADCCYMCQSLDELRLPPGFVDNADDMLCTMHRLRDFRSSGGALIFGHDPSQWARPDDGPLREIKAAEIPGARG